MNRRTFAVGGAGLVVTAALLPGVRAQEMRTITSSLGTYQVPVNPQRVVAIDSRLDLQPALALGLPVVGYGHSVPGPWVPVREGLEFYGSEINIEQVLASDPDLIICSDYDPNSVWWPANKLKTIAPVVPTAGDKPWKDAFRELASLLGREGEGEAGFAEYDALIADIKARRAEQIATNTLVSVQPGDGVIYLMNGPKMLQPQVLADLGAKTVPPDAGQDYDLEVAPEAFGDRLGGVDGILLATADATSVDGIKDDPIWSRLKAIGSQSTVSSNGNINYGSLYSAMQVARLVDELYGKLA